MFGSKHIRLSMALMAVLFLAGTAAAERKLPGRDFRVGLNLEPGFKFASGSGFAFQVGLMLKFNEKTSLIPHFGTHPYTYEEETSYTYLSGYDPVTFDPVYSTQMITDTVDNTAINIGLTLRYEMLKVLPARNTRFEYDTEGEEFVHYQYYAPLRPYFQAHLGTFMGAGMGINYYITGNTAMGLGLDFGYNLQAEESAGFGIIPKGILIIGF